MESVDKAKPRTFSLGVTGGIGSGKSTVCAILKDLGARVFDADAEAKRIMVEHPDVRREIAEAFGDESYNAEGRLNRTYLAQQIFGDENKVARINRIVHPRVFEAFQRIREQAIADGVPLLVHEAALIFESGGDRHLDAVAVVHAPQEERIRRVLARDAANEKQIRDRMRHQLPIDESMRRADYVIENDGTPEQLRRNVTALYKKLTASE